MYMYVQKIVSFNASIPGVQLVAQLTLSDSTLQAHTALLWRSLNRSTTL